MMLCLPWTCLWPPASCRVTVSAELGKRSQTDSLVSRWSTFCASSSPVYVLSCVCVHVCMCVCVCVCTCTCTFHMWCVHIRFCKLLQFRKYRYFVQCQGLIMPAMKIKKKKNIGKIKITSYQLVPR